MRVVRPQKNVKL